MFGKICVLGAGSAGLIAALTLKRRFPQVDVTVVGSSEIGVIGVGEGTTNAIPKLLFQYLGLKPQAFYEQVQPTWKMGLRFLWGSRPEFYYTFGREFVAPVKGADTHVGALCTEDADFLAVGQLSALMAAGKCFLRTPQGTPQWHTAYAWHIENKTFVAWLESTAQALGIRLREGTVAGVESTGERVNALLLENGQRISADFFVDASGFRSEILGRHLGVAWEEFSQSLFCDRALIGFWPRAADDPIRPYTTVETYDAGWCWRIEHEKVVNRGYVFSSQFLSDEAARKEYLAKNPQALAEPRIVKFRTGCLKQAWVGNVVAVGNAVGFVEPLEATALQILAQQCVSLVGCLNLAAPDRVGMVGQTVRDYYNLAHRQKWEAVRDFLACHYRYNTRLDTPFWLHCRHHTPLAGAQGFVEFFQENGVVPESQDLLLDPTNAFGAEGYLALLLGQAVPFKKNRPILPAWRDGLNRAQNTWKTSARHAFSVSETLTMLRRSGFSVAYPT